MPKITELESDEPRFEPRQFDSRVFVFNHHTIQPSNQIKYVLKIYCNLAALNLIMQTEVILRGLVTARLQWVEDWIIRIEDTELLPKDLFCSCDTELHGLS